MNAKDIPRPKDWPDLIRRVMIHAVSLAHFDIICAWSKGTKTLSFQSTPDFN